MFKNYFKTAWRTITKNKVYSLINILGLMIGLCACMLVTTVVVDDLSYDRQWSRENDIYRIISVNKMGEGLDDRFAASFTGLATELKKNFPEVETVTELSLSDQRIKLNERNPNGMAVNTLIADITVWQMLDIKVKEGNPRNYVSGTANIVITESFKDKFFPKENIIGKIIHDVPVYDNESNPLLITGVIKDLPSNSVFRADIIQLKKPKNDALYKQQYGTYARNYILMKPGTDMQKFTQKVNKWYAGFVEDKNPVSYEFQPLKDIYLHSDFVPYQKVKNDYQNILILLGIALLLLIIACVNFVNLSTARAIYRLKETGVRKILGARRSTLIVQFLTESVLFFVIGAMLATVLYQISLKPLEIFLGHSLAKNFFITPSLFIMVYAGIFLVSVLAGLYPACILSGFKPAATLKGKLFTGNSTTQNFVRKGLVVLQLAISIFVLVALIVVQQQVSFMKNKDIGFNKNNLLNISFINWNGKGQTFKNELLKLPGILNTSIANWSVGEGPGYMSRIIDDPDNPSKKINVWYINGDAGLAQTLGLQLIKGRYFNEQLITDAVPPDSAQTMERRSALLTAYSSRFLHAQQLNKYLPNVKIIPVGIVKDFNNESLKTPIQPTIITAEDSLNYGSMLVRVQPGSEQNVMASINKLWRQFYPEKLLEIKWVDNILSEQYKAESKLQKLFTFFSTLTMLLSALGIFGLIVQATSQRVKEIGIRKVLGASVDSIVKLFSIDFIKLTIIALLLASPVAWWIMNKWLMDYAYRIHIKAWVFALAGAIALLIALATISFQTIKAAIANPVAALRSE